MSDDGISISTIIVGAIALLVCLVLVGIGAGRFGSWGAKVDPFDGFEPVCSDPIYETVLTESYHSYCCRNVNVASYMDSSGFIKLCYDPSFSMDANFYVGDGAFVNLTEFWERNININWCEDLLDNSKEQTGCNAYELRRVD